MKLIKKHGFHKKKWLPPKEMYRGRRKGALGTSELTSLDIIFILLCHVLVNVLNPLF